MPVIDSTYLETPFLPDDPATMLSLRLSGALSYQITTVWSQEKEENKAAAIITCSALSHDKVIYVIIVYWSIVHNL